MSELSAHEFRRLFGAIGDRYENATRMARELRRRADALDAEHNQWMQAFADPNLLSRARLELKEIEALRPRVERSATAWAEKARALELIVGSCLIEASLHRFRRRAESRPVPDIPPVAPPQPTLWPDHDPGGTDPRVEPGVVCSNPDASPT
ncbi:MAG: hypothetical protein LC663_05555 [Actinobacteria bacterium]|nr:hypothetical protein [Actinomycetota bacterium]